MSTSRPRDARGRFIKATPTPPQRKKLVNNEHDTLHQTLREVNRMADGGEEPSVDKSLKTKRFMERALHWLFVAFVVWILWTLFVA